VLLVGGKKAQLGTGMRILRMLILVWGALIACPVQGQEWVKAYREAQTLSETADLAKAFGEANRALQLYQQESGETNDNYAAILRLIANICFLQENFELGLDYALKEIQIREHRPDTLLATAFANAAQFMQQLGSHKMAIETLAKSKEILLNFYKPEDEPVVNCELGMAINHYLADQNQTAFALFEDSFSKVKEFTEETLTAYYYFALLNLELGKTQEAISQFADLQKKYEEVGLTDEIGYAMVLKGLGEAYHRGGDFMKSEMAYAKGQTVCESNDLTQDETYLYILNGRAINAETIGNEAEAQALLDKIGQHPDGKLAYAVALNNSAALHQSRGNLDHAEELYRKSLAANNKADRTSLITYAETEENLAILLSEKNKGAEALDLMKSSAQVITEIFGADHVRYISSVNKTAIVQFGQGKYAAARASYTKAIQLSNANQSPDVERIIAMTGLAQCMQKELDYHGADSIYQAALKLYDRGLVRDNHYASLLTNYASSLQEQGKWFDARDVMIKTARHIRTTRGAANEHYAVALEGLAMLNLRLGDQQRAKLQLDSAIAIFDTPQKQKSQNYGSLLMDLGRYYQIAGDYPKAEVLFRQSVDILKSQTGQVNETYALAINALALHYETMGNYAEAEPLLKQALDARGRLNGKLNAEYSTVLQNLASLYQLMEAYDKAEPLLTEALDIDMKVLGTEHPQYSISLQNLATLYQKRKDFAKATGILENVRTLTEKSLGKSHPSYATVVSNLAALYQDQEKYPQSEKLWKESIELRRAILGEEHPDYARSLYGLAGVYFATGKLDEARTQFNIVIDKYQSQISSYFSALSEKEKGAFYNRIKPVFEAYQDLCVQMVVQKKSVDAARDLYNIQLSTKAILLNASSKVRSVIMASGDPALLELFRQWQESKERLVLSYNYSREEREQLHVDLRQLEAASNDLEKRISGKSELFGTQLGKKAATWMDVKGALKENETAIEILRVRKKFATDSVYYAALILSHQDEAPKLFIWPNGRAMENKMYRFHRNSIKFQLADTLSYRYFWQPIARVLPSTKKLYVSSDGIFNKINLNGIQDPKTGKFVIDNYEIRLLSNTRELTESHPSMAKSNLTGSVFGYADFNLAETDKAVSTGKRAIATRFGFTEGDIPMLPATEKEVNLLNGLLKEKQWRVQSFTLSQATEANLKNVHDPQILHIATHGFFLGDVDINDELQTDEERQITQNPLFRSGILLAGAALKQESGQEDGVLTAFEAMNLHLDKTELVSLSACETGLGEVRNGEGVYGLQRSFLVAGARTVVMSLWQVDDVATQELMSSFYKSWLSGGDKFQSFRQAQLEIKERYKHPFYWAAFVLIGN
jgi:CHAT domain-containing protein/tetratricopeptide (TPR) repeat protein